MALMAIGEIFKVLQVDRIVWLTSTFNNNMNSVVNFSIFYLLYFFCSHLYIRIFYGFCFWILSFSHTDVFHAIGRKFREIKITKWYDRNKSEVCRMLAGWLAGAGVWTQKNLQKKLCWNCPLESPAIYMQYSTWLVQTYKHCGSSRDKKSKARYTQRKWNARWQHFSFQLFYQLGLDM